MMEVGKGAIREEEGPRVLFKETIGKTYPMKGEVMIRMGTGFKKATYRAEEERT